MPQPQTKQKIFFPFSTGSSPKCWCFCVRARKIATNRNQPKNETRTQYAHSPIGSPFTDRKRIPIKNENRTYPVCKIIPFASSTLNEPNAH